MAPQILSLLKGGDETCAGVTGLTLVVVVVVRSARVVVVGHVAFARFALDTASDALQESVHAGVASLRLWAVRPLSL